MVVRGWSLVKSHQMWNMGERMNISPVPPCYSILEIKWSTTTTTPNRLHFRYIMGPGMENEKSWPYVPSIHMFYCLMLNNNALGHVKLYSKVMIND